MEEQNILIRFSDKEMTGREYLKFSSKILKKLQAFSNEFEHLYTLDPTTLDMKNESVDTIEISPENLEEKFAYKLEDENSVYAFINSDKSDKKYNPNSKSYTGYQNSYVNSEDYFGEQIKIDISAGKYQAKKEDVGVLNFLFSESLQPKLTFDHLLKLLEFSLELVPVVEARIYTFEFSEKVNEWGQDIDVGWVNYFSSPKVSTLLPNNVERKVFPNGGVLFWLSDVPVDSTNKKVVKKALEIRNILNDHGLLTYSNLIG